MSDVNFLNALLTKLRTDTGVGSLVTLAGSTARILRTPEPTKLTIPTVGVRILAETDLVKDMTGWKTYSVRITSAATKEVNAMALADRVMYLFDDVTGSETNRSFYDFSDSNCNVRSTRWGRRLQRFKHVDENVTYWDDSNIITIVANPYLGC